VPPDAQLLRSFAVMSGRMMRTLTGFGATAFTIALMSSGFDTPGA
jgi:hypothetical protein